MPACSVGGLISCASICFKGTSNWLSVCCCLLRVFLFMSPEMSLPKMVGSAGKGCGLKLPLTACHSSRAKPLNFSNAKLRRAPGGMPASICAASARMVPEPHIGSSSTMPGFPPAALEQGFAGCVQIQREVVRVEKADDAHVGRAGIDRRAFRANVAEAVAYRILDFQCGELEAAQGRLDGGEIDADRAIDVEPVFPALRQREIVNVILVQIAAVRQAQQHARGDARMQVDAVGVGQLA